MGACKASLIASVPAARPAASTPILPFFQKHAQAAALFWDDDML